jgi:hypothetical protein
MKELWNEYASAWSIQDAAARRKILESRLVPDVQYVDPHTETLGYDAIADYMLEFQTNLPGRRFVILQVITHHGRCLAHWEMQDKDGDVEMKGASFAEINGDGRLRRIYGFFDLASA